MPAKTATAETGQAREPATRRGEAWSRVFSSPTVASLSYYLARLGPHEGATLRAIQDQVPLSAVALRNALRTLVGACLVREDKSGKSSVYRVADPERLAWLAAYVERSDPELAADNESSGLLWACALVAAPDRRRRMAPVGLHDPGARRDLTSILPGDATDGEAPTAPRHRPPEAGRRAREARE